MTQLETTAGAQAKVDAALSSIEPRIAAQYDFASTLGNYPTASIASISGTLTQTSANNGIGVRWRPHRDMSITKLIWFTGSTVAGNYDIAILDPDGERLWSKGSTAYPGATAASVETVSPAVDVTAGTEYVIMLACSDATATFRGLASGFNEQGQYVNGDAWARVKTSMMPIPDPVAMGTTQSTRIPLVIIREA